MRLKPRTILSTLHDFKMKKKTRRAFRFELVAHDTGFITEKPRRATGVEPAIPGIQSVCASPRAIVAWLGFDGWTKASDGWLDVIRAPLQRMDRMGRTDQLARCSAGRYLTFDPAEVTGCSATLYATDTRQPAQLHSLCAGRFSSPTPPHYAYVCVLRRNVWAVRGTCLAVAEHVLRMRGRLGRRGGSKACLSIGASHHWYPCDLYIHTVHITVSRWPQSQIARFLHELGNLCWTFRWDSYASSLENSSFKFLCGTSRSWSSPYHISWFFFAVFLVKIRYAGFRWF